ncbi:MAG: hypothetical protein CMF74_16685 [Maricaulis sp.]|nr:hypothetical protein [Maricaulis sp.]
MNWFDVIKMPEEKKGLRKVREFLRENGYVVTETNTGGKHKTITVKKLDEEDNPEAKTHTMTVSHKVVNKGDKQNLKTILGQIKRAFGGRRRRGQGEFKLKTDETNEENWWGVIKSVEKIRTSSGNRLRVADVGAFKRRARIVLSTLRGADTRKETRDTVTRVRIDEVREKNPKLLHLRIGVVPDGFNEKNRQYYHIMMVENEDEDYEYLRVYGPGFVANDDDEYESEYEIIMAINEAIEELEYESVREVIDLNVKGEDEKTTREIAAELEAANPGYRYVNGRLIRKPRDEYLADMKEYNQEEVNQNMNTIEERLEMDTGLDIEAFINELRRR